MSTQRYDFTGRLGKGEPQGDGSVRFPARLTRTGVFDYGDHKELRLPEEVFSADALGSFKGITVTEGHQAHIDAANWKEHAIGHVGDDVRRDGTFVAASLVVSDAAVLDKIESGELRELSMGYTVDLESSTGEHEGETYDAIQRNIRGNHAALGGTDWGRAGPDVRLMLDAKGCSTCGAPTLDAMATHVTNQARIDAPPAARVDAPTANADDGLRKDLDTARTDLDRVRAERDAAISRADKAEAERDTARTELGTVKKAVETESANFDARVSARVKLISDARIILGADFAPKGETDREIRIAALKKVDASFDEKDRSDGYLEARFELAIPTVTKDQNALAALGTTSMPVTPTNPDAPTNTDSGESPVDKARAEMAERHSNAWKPKKA